MINIILTTLFLLAFSGVTQAGHENLLGELPEYPPYLSIELDRPYGGYSGQANEEQMQRVLEQQIQQQRELDALRNQIRRQQQQPRRRAGESLLAPRYFDDSR